MRVGQSFGAGITCAFLWSFPGVAVGQVESFVLNVEGLRQKAVSGGPWAVSSGLFRPEAPAEAERAALPRPPSSNFSL